MDTILLDPIAWDLLLDTSGNFALASEPWALAQDVATALRTFLGEVIYDTTLGVAYLSNVFTGPTPPLSLIQAQFVAIAEAVPDVATAQCTIASFVGGVLKGQVSFIDVNGQANGVSFS